MKKKTRITALAVCLCVLLCGCDLWMDGSYHNVRPHYEESVEESNQTVEVSSYTELRQRLIELVESGRQSSMIYLSSGSQQLLQNYMEMASEYVIGHNAIGAYAVDEIVYEVGTSGAKPAVAVAITYLHGRSEILHLKQAQTMDEAIHFITTALNDCDAGVVMKVEQFEKVDFIQLIQDYVDENPQLCMEMPQVTTVVYPDSGTERVVELSFTYQTSREALRSMQTTVKQIFASARLYVSADAEDWEKYSQLYSFLMERYDYTVETSITPSYSLLRHGVGDSKAFAAVYAAMCRRSGLDCQVVSGTRAGEPWCWNVLFLDGVYYHIDLLRCSQSDGFRARTVEEMSGYVWDYSEYELQSEEAA